MTQCWSEGALRAYLDRELPPEDMKTAAAHLGECTVCEGCCRELAGRAARVAALVDLLPELEAERVTLPVRRRQGVRPRVGWVGAAVALAAGLGIAAYLVPARRTGEVKVVAAPASAPAVMGPAVMAPTVMASTTAAAATLPREPAMATRPARNRVRRVRRAVPEANDFVALDDEPFESGVIIRVAVTPGNTQADIVFGLDGRARAFRLVKALRQNY